MDKGIGIYELMWMTEGFQEEIPEWALVEDKKDWWNVITSILLGQ